MRLECQHTQGMFSGANTELVAGDFARCLIHDWPELEQLGSQPNGLFAVLFVNAGSATEFLKIAAVRLFPQHRTVAQNLAGHLRQPGREVGFEMAVLLVDGCKLARVRQRLARKAPEILVFAHLGVVHVALAPNPLQQGLRLRESGVAAKTIADLHVSIIMAN